MTVSGTEPDAAEPGSDDDGFDLGAAETSIRPDLGDLGIDEIERGICRDSYENRRILRRAKLTWIPVYTAGGTPTGLIMARSQEMEARRAVMSLAERRPIMANPADRNSDYLTGVDLLVESASDILCPPWVLGATKKWVAEQEAGGPPSARRAPAGLPARCRHIKDDGIRCLLWTSGRPKDDGLCNVHLRSAARKPGDDVERARRKLTQAAPYAVDTLEELMQSAASEPVRLKASTEILDRAGIRGGVELDANVEVTDRRSAADLVADRLARLASGAEALRGLLLENAVDAEIVEESGTPDDE
jgi:hypothetical protein